MGSQVPALGTPAIRVIATNTAGGEQGFEWQQRAVLSSTKDVREDPTRLVVKCPP
jgi:hypothetical protein